MWIYLIIFLFIVPLIEIWILVLLGIGNNLTTIFSICGITGIAGWWLMRKENLSIWTLIETEMQNKRIPTEEVLHDFLVWFSGLCLLIPGLLTDGLGFLLIIPFMRQEIIEWLRKTMQNNLRKFQS